jgi:hypothetical protein
MSYNGKILKEFVEPIEVKERKVFLVEEYTTTMKVRWHNYLVTERSFHDMYGLFTSVKNAIKDAEEFVAKEGITSESEVYVQVMVYKHHRKKEKVHWGFPKDDERFTWQSLKDEVMSEECVFDTRCTPARSRTLDQYKRPSSDGGS